MDKTAVLSRLASLDSWALVCIALVGLGVAGEFVVHFLYARATRQLEAITESEALSQQTEVARLQAETERERLERVKIEEKLAPRSLSPEQQDALIAKLKPFAGQVLDLFVYNSGDAMGVGERLLFALRSSNWQVSAGSGTEMGRSVHGILVEVAEEADVPSRTAAEALVVALNAERLVTLGPQPIDRRHARSFTGDNLGRALIQLVVGEKP